MLLFIEGVNGAGHFGEAGFEEGFEPLAGELHEVGDGRIEVGVLFDLLGLDLVGDLFDGDNVEFFHGVLRVEGLTEKGISGSVIDFLVESGREECGVFGLATLRAKQGSGGRPVIGGLAFAKDLVTFGAFTGPFDGDGAGIVFIVVHMAGVLSPAQPFPADGGARVPGQGGLILAVAVLAEDLDLGG